MTGARVDRARRRRTTWIVDPIGYSGLIYYDLSLATALSELGEDVVLVTSEERIAGLADRVRELHPFRGTSRGTRVARGSRHLLSLARLVGQALRRRPTLMHWQYLAVPTLDAMAVWLLRRAGIRQVYTAHEVAPWHAGRRVLWAMRLLYRSVDAVVVHHDADVAPVRAVARRGDMRLAVIGHGSFELFAQPDLPQSEARASLNLSPRAPVALFFGSLRQGKGLEDLIEAWPSVVASLPDARLLIVGKPTRRVTRDSVLSSIRSSGAGATIEARLEQVDGETANACYRAADVVVLPYREITTSGVLRYAWSSARTVVATAVGEHSDLVTPAVGVLVPPADPAALGRALTGVLADRGAAAEMGRLALEAARRDLSWTRSARATRELYGSVSAEGGASRARA